MTSYYIMNGDLKKKKRTKRKRIYIRVSIFIKYI